MTITVHIQGSNSLTFDLLIDEDVAINVANAIGHLPVPNCLPNVSDEGRLHGGTLNSAERKDSE